VTFESLAKAFLSFFQLPICHDIGLELLSKFKQTTTIHIADHIHEWRRRRSLCKAETTKEQCLDWFLKSFVSIISKDVSSTFPQLEEEAIIKAQQFNLIYAQSIYLYTVLPDAPRPIPFGLDKPGISHVARWVDWFYDPYQPLRPPVTHLWCTSISATIWRNAFLPSSHSPIVISCCSPSTNGWTLTDAHDASSLSTKYEFTLNPHI
jgi:hypothetical protein